MSHNLMKYELDNTDEYGFAMEEHFVLAGTQYPLHWHDFLEFEIVISGSAKHIYNGETYKIEAGDAYLMCYYDFHELEALTDVRLYSIHFSKHLVAPELAAFLDFNKFHCRFEEKEAQRILQRVRELKEETAGNQPFQKLIMKNIISEIVIAMIRKSTTKEIRMTPLPIQQAVVYINTHFLEKITLEALAEQLSFSVNYLGQLFRNQIGCTFHEYLNTLRLKYACNLLAASDMSVKEIAFSSGYTSVEYFMYVFKKKMLMTPGEYRSKGV